MSSQLIVDKCFDNEKFAQEINAKLFRERSGQNEGAKAIGVSNSTICRVVSKRLNPDVASLVKILDWLGMKFEEFVK